MSDERYVPLDEGAAKLGLPSDYLRHEIGAGRLPGMKAAGRMFVQVGALREKLGTRHMSMEGTADAPRKRNPWFGNRIPDAELHAHFDGIKEHVRDYQRKLSAGSSDLAEKAKTEAVKAQRNLSDAIRDGRLSYDDARARHLKHVADDRSCSMGVEECNQLLDTAKRLAATTSSGASTERTLSLSNPWRPGIEDADQPAVNPWLKKD